VKPNYTVRDELEDIIDERGSSAVPSMIADVCCEKAEHLLSNCQDESAAAVWLYAGYHIRMAAVSEAVKATSYGKGDEPDRKDLRHLMPTFRDDPASRFLEYYQQYLIAKGQQNREMIWFCTVACRIELRKMDNPAEEAQNCQNLSRDL
jgi:hypothetical protein